MKQKLIILAVAAIGMAASPALLAQGCCSEGGAKMEGCAMGGMPAGGASASSQISKAVFAKPVQAVFDNYIKAQGYLAQDSLDGFRGTAAALLKSVNADTTTKALSPKIEAQAGAVAAAKDLESARAAFKPLSESLIAYVKEQKVAPGTYREAYCPMAKASWLQTGDTVMNPYMGKSMAHCGQFKS